MPLTDAQKDRICRAVEEKGPAAGGWVLCGHLDWMLENQFTEAPLWSDGLPCARVPGALRGHPTDLRELRPSAVLIGVVWAATLNEVGPVQ